MGAKKVVLMLSYPSDEVGNALVSQDQLDGSRSESLQRCSSPGKYRSCSARTGILFTGVDYGIITAT